MDSKSFNLSVEEVGGKSRGFIEKRGRGLSTWIRFGDVSLRRLLARMESCYKDEDLVGRSSEWEEEGKKSKLECRSNKAGSFYFVQW